MPKKNMVHLSIRFPPAAKETWPSHAQYREQASNGTTQNRSYYDTQLEDYALYSQTAVTAARQARGQIETALICGMGLSLKEVTLVTTLFPEVRRIRAVEWHLPNLHYCAANLMRRIAEGKFSETKLEEVVCHYDDLRQLSTVPPDEVDFAFTNKVFDLFDDYPGDRADILKNIARSLHRSGVLFSFDFPMPTMQNRLFDYHAQQAGLAKVADRIYRKE